MLSLTSFASFLVVMLNKKFEEKFYSDTWLYLSGRRSRSCYAVRLDWPAEELCCVVRQMRLGWNWQEIRQLPDKYVQLGRKELATVVDRQNDYGEESRLVLCVTAARSVRLKSTRLHN